ncbi:hypothetical protein FGRA07_01348, partial [Fusarium graminearum]
GDSIETGTVFLVLIFHRRNARSSRRPTTLRVSVWAPRSSDNDYEVQPRQHTTLERQRRYRTSSANSDQPWQPGMRGRRTDSSTSRNSSFAERVRPRRRRDLQLLPARSD